MEADYTCQAATHWYRSDSQTDGKEGSEKVSNFTSVNILDMINAIGEEELQLILSDFSCLKNHEIEELEKTQ